MQESYFEKIARKLPGFEVREGQLQMFHDVMAAYKEGRTYLIEAGTGTGKSLAYLIPALLWALEHKEPTVVATHTIALQEQLMQKDIPFLLDALELDLKVVLVKGMQNYVCLRKLEDVQTEIPESLLGWAKTTSEGSRSELPYLPTPDLWEQIGAEADNCTHMKCPHYKRCFFFKARKGALDAHLLVVNHHLFFADLKVREESENYKQTAVLPPYQRLILDEAHHCEEVATQYFAQQVSRRGLIYSLGRLSSDHGTGKLVTLYRKLCELYPQHELLTESLTLLLPAEKGKISDLVNQAFEVLSTFFATHTQDEKLRLRQWHLQDPFWTFHVQPIVVTAVQEGKRFVQAVLLLEEKLNQLEDPLLESKCEGVLAEIRGICSRLERQFETLFSFVSTPLEPERVRWIEGRAPDLHLISADLDIAPRLSKALFGQLPTIVLCSATLATQGTFTFIRKQLGIERAEERIYASPFDYKTQALFLTPIDLPDPMHPSFVRAAAEKIWESVQISRGGMFVLFTSHLMLRECAQLLAERLHKKHYLLFCQGDQNRFSLLNKFRTSDRALLFGTDSFWEGVDVVGEALRCVMIVKLPFKVPSDPLFQARSEAIASRGGSPFFDYSLPQAIVKFKQGFGRLIRNKLDRGCVICLDPRIVKKGYGKQFLQSLPECPTLFEPGAQVLETLKKFFTGTAPTKPVSTDSFSDKAFK
jgi:ATP-dependent DNA helicase DinG